GDHPRRRRRVPHRLLAPAARGAVARRPLRARAPPGPGQPRPGGPPRAERGGRLRRPPGTRPGRRGLAPGGPLAAQAPGAAGDLGKPELAATEVEAGVGVERTGPLHLHLAVAAE